MVFCRKREKRQKSYDIEYETGLPNMRGFETELDYLRETGDLTQYSAYYLDIVRMGMINSRYGKQGGDRILVQFVQFLLGKLDRDEILCRLGSDFFIALVKKEKTADFLGLLKEIPLELVMDGQSRCVNISVLAGIYEIDSASVTAGDILSKASAAASYAKNTLHAPFAYMDNALEKELYCRYELQEEIIRGLAMQEFEPFYQPKVDSRDNSLIGAEALARWKHKGAYRAPTEFIPEMERSSLICNLDFYMLDHVCRDIRGWMEQGYPVKEVSVNFSRKNLSDPELAERIHEVLEANHIPRNMIQIEITETLNEYSTVNVKDLVDRLRSYGISSAIDDFGSGCSSITLLKEAHFKDLKIDKTFVSYSGDMERQLLEDIIHMVKNMKMNVIAEGVENGAQVRELNGMDCYLMQGYYFAKPMPKAQFETDWVSGTASLAAERRCQK